MGAYEEGSWRKATDSVVCPKPRRAELRLPFNHGVEMGNAGARSEILDIILLKGGYVGEISGYKDSSSPPFFFGSPPSRVSNPVIQDAYFVDEKVTQLHPGAALALSFPSSSSSGLESQGGGGGGRVCSKFRNMQAAAVRIEGFDCLSRDGRRNCSILTMA